MMSLRGDVERAGRCLARGAAAKVQNTRQDLDASSTQKMDRMSLHFYITLLDLAHPTLQTLTDIESSKTILLQKWIGEPD